MKSSIDVEPNAFETILDILNAHVTQYEIRAFGSRVLGTATKTSDFDLVIMTDKPLQTGRMADLREAFVQSNLPFKVDLLDWSLITESLRKLIEENFQVVQAPLPPDS